MACPNCGCKVTYQVTGALEDLFEADDEDLERCAACTHVFYVEDYAPESDDED